MDRNSQIYDLGEVQAAFGRAARIGPQTLLGTAPGRPKLEAMRQSAIAHFVSDSVLSLSVFIPGATQLLQGRVTLGLFFLSWTIFVGSMGWAVLRSMDRLAPTLEVLGQPAAVVYWSLGALFLLGAAVHLTAVGTAFDSASERPVRPRFPIVPALASLLVPGWGQILNGSRTRALVFLAGGWVALAAWLASADPTTALLSQYVPVVEPWEQALRAPLLVWTAKWTLPFVVWSLAVYDAAFTAVARRHNG